MSENIFIPKSPDTTTPVSASKNAQSPFLGVQRLLLLVLAAALPVVFLPIMGASVSFTKVVFVATIAALILIIGALSVLVQQQSRIYIPKPYSVMWLFAGFALLSGVIAADVTYAVQGSMFEVFTAGFLALFVLVTSLPMVIQGSPRLFHTICNWLSISVLVLVFYNIARVILGPDWLSFGLFPDLILSPFGSLNDLTVVAAALLGAVIMRLTLRNASRRMYAFYTVAILLCTVMLSLINIPMTWWCIGLLAAAAALFIGTQTQWKLQDKKSLFSMGLVCAVFLFAAIHIFGSANGSLMQRAVDFTYIEVRPSFEVSTEILRTVYADSFIAGAGPNQFDQIWRFNKDESLNQTMFWATEFQSGFSFVITIFILFGLIGGGLLVMFHAWFLWIGYRALTDQAHKGSPWYTPTVSMCAAAIILNVHLYLYTPGVTALLITALVTGCALVGVAMLLPRTTWVLSFRKVSTGPNIGKLVMVLVVIGVTSLLLLAVWRQFLVQTGVGHSIAAGTITAEELYQAYQAYPDERFLRFQVELALTELNGLLQLTEFTAEDEAAVASALELAIASGKQAVLHPNATPASFVLLASVYNVLAIDGNEDAREATIATLREASQRDPWNPELQAYLARVYLQGAAVEDAAAAANRALELKSNYAPALLLQAEIALAQEDVPRAIDRLGALIQLDPANPVHYVQIGLLFLADNKQAEAIASFEQALFLDESYSDARYLLAQVYFDAGRAEEAITLLKVVMEANPNNTDLQTQLVAWENQLLYPELSASTTAATASSSSPTTTVLVPAEVSVSEQAVSVTEQPNTDLVTPVNQTGE